MPSPNGPSRSTVGGTMSQPLASETCQAGDLAPGQRPVGEVVERTFADRRLVDRGRAPRAAPGLRAGQVTVTSSALLLEPMIAPDDLDVAVAQDLERRGSVGHAASPPG